jgi:hypothetical protein
LLVERARKRVQRNRGDSVLGVAVHSQSTDPDGDEAGA